MNTYSFSVIGRNGWGLGFGPRPTHCHKCTAELPAPKADTCAAGYGCGARETIPAHIDAPVLKPGETLARSPAVCYACCAADDKARMIDTGRAVLYLTTEKASGRALLSNWPGSLTFRGGTVRKGAHNMARYRYDAWFTGPDGAPWHAVQYGGNTQIAHCKRVKA